jgi:SAM-dependent methyltransferase
MNDERQAVRAICPFCGQPLVNRLGGHIREAHGEDRFRQAVLKAKAGGMPDAEIGAQFGISFRQLERLITETYSVNVSALRRPKTVRAWQPRNFREETRSVWSFRQRGNWATHDGRYRGNWSPYIPRNVILKYSKPGDIVLDHFVGGGTTAIEAKLLGRRCMARDINPAAVALALDNLNFHVPLSLFKGPIYEPQVAVGDARDLSDIPDSSVDLICAHPPYAGVIGYSAAAEGDLSQLPLPAFLSEMGRVARESLRVLKPGGKCAILIGDTRQFRHVVPIGFQTMRVFLDAGFILRELVIKCQHHCKATGFWYARSLQHNFLLLAHEYLPVFEKPAAGHVAEGHLAWESGMPYQIAIESAWSARDDTLETTTVWIFPQEHLEAEVRRNLLRRFASPNGRLMEIRFTGAAQTQTQVHGFTSHPSPLPQGGRGDRALPSPLMGEGQGGGDRTTDVAQGERGASVVAVRWPDLRPAASALAGYRTVIRRIAEQATSLLPHGGFLVVEAQDVRADGVLWPMGLLLYEDMVGRSGLALKEIVVVVPEEPSSGESGEYLEIVHRYLLVYVVRPELASRP